MSRSIDRVALRRASGACRREIAHVGGGRRQAGEIEIDAAQELLVGAELRRQDLHPLPFGRDEFVDLVPLLGLPPGEAGRSPITVTVVAA